MLLNIMSDSGLNPSGGGLSAPVAKTNITFGCRESGSSSAKKSKSLYVHLLDKINIFLSRKLNFTQTHLHFLFLQIKSRPSY